jgi:YVTN family beta-propeller protein
MVYVADAGGSADSLSVIQESTQTLVDTISLGNPVAAVAVDPITDTVYAAEYNASTGAGLVTAIDGQTDATIGSPIPVGDYPSALAVDAGNDTIYAVNNGDGTTSVIDGLTAQVENIVTVGGCPNGVAVDQQTNIAYVAVSCDSSVAVLSGENLVTSIPNVPSVYGLAVDPTTNTIYASNNGLYAASVISGATDTVTGTISGLGQSPNAIAVDPQNDVIYISNDIATPDNFVSVVNGATNDVTGTITVGQYPAGVAFDAETGALYVTNSGDGTVSALGDGCTPSTGYQSCTIGATATISGGSLTIAAPANLGWNVTLAGADQFAGAPATLEPMDLTGSGAGWSVSAAATPFTDGTRTLGALYLNGSGGAESESSAPLDSCAVAGDCTLPTSSVGGYPLPVASVPATIYSAAAGTGLGMVDLATDWWLDVPGAANAGTYTSTITLAISSGP